MTEALHISSFVAQVTPGMQESLKQQMQTFPNTEVPLEDAAGKFVVVIDGDSIRGILDIAGQIRDLSGVLSFTPVYQHSEPSTPSTPSPPNAEL